MRRVRKGGVYHQCDARIESRLRGRLISMVVRDLYPSNCGIFQGTSFRSVCFHCKFCLSKSVHLFFTKETHFGLHSVVWIGYFTQMHVSGLLHIDSKVI